MVPLNKTPKTGRKHYVRPQAVILRAANRIIAGVDIHGAIGEPIKTV